MRTIPQIIDACGGPALMATIALAHGVKINRTLPYKWAENGRIPDKHWHWVMKAAKASPKEMFNANRAQVAA